MDKKRKIIEKLKGLHAKGHYDNSAIIIGTVSAVNGIDTIDVDVDGVLYNDVQLQSIIDGSSVSLLVVPKKGSAVLIGNIEHSTGYILLSADVADKIVIKQADDMYIEVAKNVIKLNGDGNNGLVKVKDLVSKLNLVENQINKLKQLFASWVVAPSDGGAALKTVLASWVTPLANTQQNEIENTKVKHG